VWRIRRAPPRMRDLVPAELNCVADAAIAKRGDALALNRLFIQTPVPMVLMRNDRQLHDANPAAQLSLRRRVGDLRRAPAGDLAALSRVTHGTALRQLRLTAHDFPQPHTSKRRRAEQPPCERH
ncbi:MAG: hypothetical protein M3N56_07920, partial [Actinomycetota bacterium]|nr:hypothetical protein [Actinomycetota bacterium]